MEEHFRSQAFRDALQAGRISGAEVRNPVVERAAALLDDVGEARLADLAAAGIDVQVLSHNVPGPELFEPGDAVELAQAMNDELAALIRSRPGRYAGFAMLPTPDPEAAARELRRATQELGLAGAMVHGTTGGRFLDDPAFEPILASAAELGVPLYLHPAAPLPAVQEAYYAGFSEPVSLILARSGWGWHIETGVHALRLVLAGAFDRHPGLQIVIGHMGEAVPFMLARADSVLSRVSGLERPVADYFRQNVHYTTSGFFTEPPLRCLLDVVGVERVLFAVDYPFSSNAAGRAFLDSVTLGEADRERLAHANAEALLKL